MGGAAGVPEWSPTTWLLVYTVIVVSMASVVWFFMVRRQMIARMRAVVGILEDTLRPRDKTYTLLGYLVGFRAEYQLSRPKTPRAWILYTMPPGHVFLYLPVIALLRERDRLELTLRLRGLTPGQAHIVDPRDRRTMRELRRDLGDTLAKLTATTIETPAGTYRAYYDSNEALEKARQLLMKLQGAGAEVTRVTISSKPAALHVALHPRIASLRPALETLLREAEKIPL